MDKNETIRLMIDCLNAKFDKANISRLEQLTTADWNLIAKQSLKHSVAPLFYQRLKTAPESVYPPEHVIQKLQQIYLANASKNMRIYYDLSKLAEALQADGIPIIILKGAHLAEIVYGNIALRSMCDLDILVKRTDLSKAKNRLLEMGYAPIKPKGKRGANSIHHHLPAFVKQDKSPVEIHWSLVPPNFSCKVDIKGLWNRAQPITVAGVDVLGLSPEDLLLHLCLHASTDLFRNGIKFTHDISNILRHYQNDFKWELLQLRAHRWGVNHCVYLMLCAAKELGLTISDKQLDPLRPPSFDPHLIDYALEQVFSNKDDKVGAATRIVELRKAKSFANRLHFLLKKTFIPLEILKKRYALSSNRWTYFYYLVRLKDLALRYSRFLWRLSKHDKTHLDAVGQVNRKVALTEWLHGDQTSK
jgi:hypothetical protein